MSKNFTVKINDGNKTLETVKLNTTKKVVIKVQPNVNYELVDDATQYAPQNIVTKRVGNDLYIALELYQKKDIKVLLLGGEVSSETGSTATVFSLQQIEGYNADMAFLGVSSISEFFDLTVPTEIKAFLKRTMMKISKETILLVDSSKFQKKKNMLKNTGHRYKSFSPV